MSAATRAREALLAVDRIQRGRIALDVAEADLEVVESALGLNHPTAWHFRDRRAAARLTWDALRAEFGGAGLDATLQAPPTVVVPLALRRDDPVVFSLIVILGRTFGVASVPGTPLAPIQWRLARVQPPLEFGPYYVCRLADGSVQCDCAEWVYREEAPGGTPCKHITALKSLGWLDKLMGY